MSDDLAREWRQFQLLSRDSVRRLINTAVLSRDSDPMQFAAWAVALVSTPPAMYAFSQMFLYASLRRAPAEVVERIVLGHRMFFVVYAMLATALLAALLWEALFPERVDQEILAPLPVRPRTAAAARLTAAVIVALTYSACIGIPSAVMFAFISTAHPLLGFLPTVFVAHVLATMAGSLTVFLALLLVRAIVAIALGSAAADRLATVLQFVTVIGLVEALFYLPSLLPLLVRHMLAGDVAAMTLPPVWFAALYSWLVGFGHWTLVVEGALGVVVLVVLVVVIVPVYLLPAGVMARRALESDSRQRVGVLTIVLVRMCRLLAGQPVVRAILQFTAISLARNRRHLLIVVSYAGLGIAIGFVTVLANQIRGTWLTAEPQSYLLALPLDLIFFIALGLRATFGVPTDVQANWAFRLARPEPQQAIAAARLAFVLLAVLPAAMFAAAAAAVFSWPRSTVLLLAAFDLAAGLLFVECLLLGWRTVPFTAAHASSPETLRSRWLLQVPPFIAFVVVGSVLQVAALGSPAGAAAYLVIATAAWLIVRVAVAREARRLAVQFEPSEHDAALQTLNLSEATQ